MSAMRGFSFALALIRFSPALAEPASLPDIDQILAQTRAAFGNAKTADEILAMEILCRANLTLASLKESDRLTARGLSLLDGNKIDEANELFKRVRELNEEFGEDFRERACRPSTADKASQVAALSTKMGPPDAKGDEAQPIADADDTAARAPLARPAEPKFGGAPSTAAELEKATQAEADSESSKPATSPPVVGDGSAAATIRYELQREQAQSQAPQQKNDVEPPATAPAPAESSAAAAAPSGSSPQISSLAPSAPAEAEQARHSPRDGVTDMTTSASTSGETAIAATTRSKTPPDAAAFAQSAAEAEKPAPGPSQIDSSTAVETTIDATSPFAAPASSKADEAPKFIQAPTKPDVAKPASPSSIDADATTGATRPRRPAEAAASSTTVPSAEAVKTIRATESKLAALPPPPPAVATRPDATLPTIVGTRESVVPKGQNRLSPEAQDKFITGRSPREIAKRVARTSNYAISGGGGAVDAHSSTMPRATNSERPQLQTVLHRRCPSILTSQEEYDDEVISLCGRWAKTN